MPEDEDRVYSKYRAGSLLDRTVTTSSSAVSLLKANGDAKKPVSSKLPNGKTFFSSLLTRDPHGTASIYSKSVRGTSPKTSESRISNGTKWPLESSLKPQMIVRSTYGGGIKHPKVSVLSQSIEITKVVPPRSASDDSSSQSDSNSSRFTTSLDLPLGERSELPEDTLPRSQDKLPLLTSKVEHDILGDIFSEWELEKSAPISTLPASSSQRKNKESRTKRSRKIDTEDTMRVHMSGTRILDELPVESLPRKRPKQYKDSTITSGECSNAPSVASGRGDPVEVVNLDHLRSYMPDQAHFWQVSYQDRMRAHGVFQQVKDSRERLRVCVRCAQNSNGRHGCPGSSCSLCHSLDHINIHCPFKDTVLNITCSRCGTSGHMATICPEIWRQYHSTTVHHGPLIRSTAFKRIVSCANCGLSGHFAHACRRPFYNKSTFGICSPVIKLYESGTHSSHLREDPHERFTDIIQNSMTDEDSERMSATPDHKRASRKRLRAGHALRY